MIYSWAGDCVHPSWLVNACLRLPHYHKQQAGPEPTLHPERLISACLYLPQHNEQQAAPKLQPPLLLLPLQPTET